MIAAEKETPPGMAGHLELSEGDFADYKVVRQFAKAYAALGWAVFPLRPGSKAPATAHGFRDATCDPAEIERFPENANLGIATGAAFWCLDIDGEEGRLSLERLEAEHGPLPATLTQITRNGGKHLCFQAAPNIRSRAGLLPGIDTRGFGGYIATEPSFVAADDPSGTGKYIWQDWEPPTGELPEIAEAPGWLLRIVQDAAPATAAPAPSGRVFEGGRNDHLSRRAYALKKAGAETGEILTALRRMNAECSPPLDDAELAAIARGKAGIQPDEIELTERASYRLRSAAEIAALPPVRWLLKGALPAEGLAALFGPSGSGKSFLILDAAAAIAEGRQWFGRRTTAAPVVYLGLEGEAGLAQRVQAWEQHHGRPLPEGLRFVTGQPFNLPTAEDVAELAEACRAADAGGGLTIIDTLNRAALGLDENAAEDMGRIIEAAADLQRSIGGLVLLVHHSGKDLARGMRGHSSLIAALDAAIEVKRDGDARSWSLAKSKDGSDSESIAFRLEIVGLGEDGDGEAVTSCVVIEETEQQGDSAPAKALLDAQAMRQVLVLLHETFEAGEYLTTSATAPTGTPWAVLRHMEGYPSGMRKPELMALFRAMQKAGHIRREEYTKPNRHPGERWAITAAGYTFAGIAATAEEEPEPEIASTASTASTCHFSEVGAAGAGASSALRRPTGGLGGKVSATQSTQDSADTLPSGATQTAPTAEVDAEVEEVRHAA